MKRSLVLSKLHLKLILLISLILQKEIRPLNKNSFNLKEEKSKLKLSKAPQKSLIPETTGFQVTKIIKRNKNLYTQGLFFADDGQSFYESGGLYNESSLNHFSYPSLTEIKSKKIPKKYFAEGIGQCGEFIYQLTWREDKILKFRKDDFSLLQELPLKNGMREGWGLTAFKNNLLLATDGSNNIFVLNCLNNLEKIDVMSIKYKNTDLDSLNDLAYANGFVYVNRYHDTKVYKIDPKSGAVLKAYEMRPLETYEKSKLLQGSLSHGDVLNGIAFNPVTNKFLLTGKRWRHYFEVEFE